MFRSEARLIMVLNTTVVKLEDLTSLVEITYKIEAFLLFLRYGMVLPVVVHAHLPEWQRETTRLMACGRKTSQVQPKSTLGEQMIYKDHRKETEIYFSQLRNAFNEPAPHRTRRINGRIA
ncbi:unnamed protein product [Caenorhabditis auriculariae]|uniref:Uncharacterized protein n=1 Tax=Caenorhabditis auriculariae TaxID=2777116 RepID=A0A8S1H2F8_9PELO|nr:unnamed protein product [Caenorhabditis auriculariae]